MKQAPWLIGLTIIFICYTSNASHVSGNVLTPLAAQQSTSVCYGLAMVAMDSVINSRLGVLPEHALQLALVEPGAHITTLEELYLADAYSPLLLKIVLDAYLWERAPHEYADLVLDTCSA